MTANQFSRLKHLTNRIIDDGATDTEFLEYEYLSELLSSEFDAKQRQHSTVRSR